MDECADGSVEGAPMTAPTHAELREKATQAEADRDEAIVKKTRLLIENAIFTARIAALEAQVAEARVAMEKARGQFNINRTTTWTGTLTNQDLSNRACQILDAWLTRYPQGAARVK
jgi:hypothetical protein